MAIITLLITISVTIAVGFLAVFYWNMKNGQYDDTYTPSVRILFDDKPASAPTEKSTAEKTDKNQIHA